MKYVPHEYQAYCIDYLLERPAAALWLKPGMGKTVTALTAADRLLYDYFAASKVLVIAPLRVAEDTWTREAGKWDHLKLLRIIPVLGSREKRIKALNTPGDVYVLSRDNVQWLVDHYRNAWPFDTVIIDELSSFKNPQAKRFKSLCLMKIIKKNFKQKGQNALPNGLLDLWSQIYLLDQGRRLGTRIGQYREEYFSPASRNRDTIFSYAPLPGADRIIQQRISDICISLQAKDYLQLPERIDNVIHVRLNPREQAAYEKFEREMLLEVDEATLDAGSAAVLSGKLLQFCNGAVYDNDKNAVEVHGEKLEAFKEIVEGSQGKPILVFYNFQHDKSRIIKCLPKGLRVAELKGPGVISQWNERKIDVLLAHPASAAYGLNLQAGGNIIVWFGLNWSLELYQQANARLHRQGQTDNVIIHHLIVSGGMDEDVMAALQNKQVTQDSLLAALKARIAKVKGET